MMMIMMMMMFSIVYLYQGHKVTVPVKTIVGDVRKLTEVRSVMKDVDTVIHAAGLISFGTFPDLESMDQVNVKGISSITSRHTPI